MIPRLETKRFFGIALSETHAEHLRGLYREPAVTKLLLGTDMPLAEQAVELLISRLTSHWTAHGFGPYAFFSLEERKFVGYAGLRHTISMKTAGVELLYAVRQAFWGDGVCTEIARPTVEEAWTKLDLCELVSFALPSNVGSRRVLEKIGFVYEGDCDYGGHVHAAFRLHATN